MVPDEGSSGYSMVREESSSPDEESCSSGSFQEGLSSADDILGEGSKALDADGCLAGVARGSEGPAGSLGKSSSSILVLSTNGCRSYGEDLRGRHCADEEEGAVSASSLASGK